MNKEKSNYVKEEAAEHIGTDNQSPYNLCTDLVKKLSACESEVSATHVHLYLIQLRP